MGPDGKELLNLMFREGETVCVSPNKYAYLSIPLSSAMGGRIELRSENPGHPVRFCNSSDLVFVSLNPINGNREDSNCYKYRNYMLELDTGSIKEQIEYIKKLGIPHSAMVFSGGKSVHTLIALEENLPSEKTYRFIAQWILNIATLADDKIKNPSRNFRIPGAIRDNGNKQRKIFIGKRVKLEELMMWLHKYDHAVPKQRTKKPFSPHSIDPEHLSKWARAMLRKAKRDGEINFPKGRNVGWFSLAVDFALAGYDQIETESYLSRFFTEEYDFKEKEFLTAIDSGFKYVMNGKANGKN